MKSNVPSRSSRMPRTSGVGLSAIVDNVRAAGIAANRSSWRCRRSQSSHAMSTARSSRSGSVMPPTDSEARRSSSPRSSRSRVRALVPSRAQAKATTAYVVAGKRSVSPPSRAVEPSFSSSTRRSKSWTELGPSAVWPRQEARARGCGRERANRLKLACPSERDAPDSGGDVFA